MKTMLFAIAAAFALSACGPKPTMPMQDGAISEAPAFVQSSRFTVTRVGIFADELAYSNRRGIYVIRDKETGREFVGISGVGVSEIGSHVVSTGKTTYTKEHEE